MIDHMPRADLDAPREQRHAVKRILDRLLDEHGAVEVAAAGTTRGPDRNDREGGPDPARAGWCRTRRRRGHVPYVPAVVFPAAPASRLSP
ncbi:hypothetical protein GCM10010348_79010 [Streptomyces anthocyanicus]|nr:hypothetical protein GCM10010348_79010 [Streptomyces anthocyanicus]